MTEIARDICAQTPISVPIRQQLIIEHGVLPVQLSRALEGQRNLIRRELGVLSSLVAVSFSPEVPAILGLEPSSPTPDTQPTANYAEITRSPLKKMRYDSDRVLDFLTMLGPTNPLRSEDGLDATFELGFLRRLLEHDFANLPIADKRPNLRMVEGHLAEEMALLWRPTTASDIELEPSMQGFLPIGNDPNIFSGQKLHTLSLDHRQALTGNQLCSEAANIFYDVFRDDRTPILMRMEALCRHTDMIMHGLGQMAIMMNRKQRIPLYRRMQAAAQKNHDEVMGLWYHPASEGMKKGPLFEMVVLVKERRKILQQDPMLELVRLALPREDKIHKLVPHLQGNDGREVSLSRDLIYESIDGTTIAAKQVKAMAARKYQNAVDRGLRTDAAYVGVEVEFLEPAAS